MRCFRRPGEHHLLRQPGANRVLGALGLTATRLREIRTRRRRKTDSNHRSLSGRIPLFRLVLPAGGVEEACSEKPPVLEGTGSSNPSSSSGESVSLLELL